MHPSQRRRLVRRFLTVVAVVAALTFALGLGAVYLALRVADRLWGAP